jgi:positive regulator of sigma E activity
MKDKFHWLIQPTKKQLRVALVIWLVGLVLLVVAITDFFREPFFQRKYLIVHFLIFWSGLTMLALYRRYRRSRKLP